MTREKTNVAPAPINLSRKQGWLYNGGIPVFHIEDFSKVAHLIKPQKQRSGHALRPDVAFLFSESKTHFFTIDVAMDSKGSYLFGYDLCRSEGRNGCWPSSHWKDHRRASTLKDCLIHALTYISGWSKEKDYEEYRLYERTAAEALRKLKKHELRQMTIFDMLD